MLEYVEFDVDARTGRDNKARVAGARGTRFLNGLNWLACWTSILSCVFTGLVLKFVWKLRTDGKTVNGVSINCSQRVNIPMIVCHISLPIFSLISSIFYFYVFFYAPISDSKIVQA